MSVVIQDECLKNLYYAQDAMKEWIPLTEYEVLFEAAENPETADKVAKNEETEAKTVGFLRKAIDAVIQMIKKIYYAVKDLIDRCTMSGAEREAFEQFKKEMAEDPTLKNKKITVQDFRKINAQYDAVIAEVDDAIRKVKSDADHPIDSLVQKVTGILKGAATSTATIVAADMALKMADSNVELAKALRYVLREEQGIMEQLSKTLGKRRAAKFQKEINKDAKNTMLHRLKVRLFRKQYDNIHDVIQGTIRAFTHAGFKTKSEIKQAQRDLKKDYKSGGMSKEDYKTAKKELKDQKRDAKKEIRDSLKIDRQLLHDDDVRTIASSALKATGTVAGAAVKGAVGAGKEVVSDKISTTIQDKITDRDRKKRDRKGEYKPLKDFMKKS